MPFRAESFFTRATTGLHRDVTKGSRAKRLFHFLEMRLIPTRKSRWGKGRTTEYHICCYYRGGCDGGGSCC